MIRVKSSDGRKFQVKKVNVIVYENESLNYMHVQTGEIISATCLKDALRYFKADGKQFNYKTRRNDIVVLTDDLPY